MHSVSVEGRALDLPYRSRRRTARSTISRRVIPGLTRNPASFLPRHPKTCHCEEAKRRSNLLPGCLKEGDRKGRPYALQYHSRAGGSPASFPPLADAVCLQFIYQISYILYHISKSDCLICVISFYQSLSAVLRKIHCLLWLNDSQRIKRRITRFTVIT